MSTDTEITNYQTVFVVPESAVSYFDRALDPDAVALMMGLIEKGPDKGKWKIEAIFEGEPDRQALGTLIAIAAMSADTAGDTRSPITPPAHICPPSPLKAASASALSSWYR